ncbi:MexH family multidrug efflux RND transporter periplasmic adaptor subunit [Iodidimonas muriae]|uniref:MexH family multidrug efflux RND transporter periplasmic adaptor subunit n=1 Tax=Iodidimonas muriae TaxID=261467 RepID=A0ABQ2LFB1_9PROT|nr:efflux RND transporter periplasmic adaptor subunit [Iodidimonas muriae]GGO15286.1 MexH family multidrug efflux RND transporter periplasmic adaptor subunit [Iodidimonas muriae]
MSRLISVILTLFALSILGGGIYLYVAQGDIADQRRFGDKAIPVQAAEITTHPFANRIEAIGTTEANESVTISARVSDTIESVNFSDGDIVEKGAVLVRLNRAEQEALLAEAEATMLEAKQQLERTQDLVKRGNASLAVLDERVRLVESATAQVAAAKARIADRVVRAPFAGVLGVRQVSPGALLSPGTPITTLDDVTPIKLDFAVPEQFISALSRDQRVVARAAAYPGETFTGKVTNVSSRVDPVTRAITVRAEIANEDKRLRPGMLLTVEVINNERLAIAAPEGAIIPVGEDQFVFVVKSDNTVERRQITLGLRRPGVVEVLSGLKAGEFVVTAGTMRLRPGMTVKVQNREAPVARPQA